jgi:hypothetical protein
MEIQMGCETSSLRVQGGELLVDLRKDLAGGEVGLLVDFATAELGLELAHQLTALAFGGLDESSRRVEISRADEVEFLVDDGVDLSGDTAHLQNTGLGGVADGEERSQAVGDFHLSARSAICAAAIDNGLQQFGDRHFRLQLFGDRLQLQCIGQWLLFDRGRKLRSKRQRLNQHRNDRFTVFGGNTGGTTQNSRLVGFDGTSSGHCFGVSKGGFA